MIFLREVLSGPSWPWAGCCGSSQVALPEPQRGDDGRRPGRSLLSSTGGSRSPRRCRYRTGQIRCRSGHRRRAEGRRALSLCSVESRGRWRSRFSKRVLEAETRSEVDLDSLGRGRVQRARRADRGTEARPPRAAGSSLRTVLRRRPRWQDFAVCRHHSRAPQTFVETSRKFDDLV